MLFKFLVPFSSILRMQNQPPKTSNYRKIHMQGNVVQPKHLWQIEEHDYGEFPAVLCQVRISEGIFYHLAVIS